MKLWKTTLVIWTAWDPVIPSLSALGHEAESGYAYCSKSEVEMIPDAENDPDWDNTEFFNQGNSIGEK